MIGAITGQRRPVSPWIAIGGLAALFSGALPEFASAGSYAEKPPLRLALSDLQQLSPLEQDGSPDRPVDPPGPVPDPLVTPAPDSSETTGDGGSAPAGDDLTVHYGTDALPEPVARMRELLIEAAVTGDIENLRPLIGAGANQTRLAIAGTDGDPIDYLRETSGDGAGQETLAIILDLFQSGYVVRQEEDEAEIYLWPYFFATTLEELTPAQMVELLRVVTAGDVEDMQAYGGYNFYRIGITADGEWAFFVAGD